MSNTTSTKLLRIQQVSDRVGLAKQTITLWANTGRFPRPITISPRVKAWLESDIENYISEKHQDRETV